MKKVLLLLAFYALCQAVQAQHFLHARVVDYVTNVALEDSLTQVDLLSVDSTFVETAAVYTNMNTIRKTTEFQLSVPQEGNYIVRCSHPNYYTLYVPLHVKFYKRESEIELGKFALKRKSTFTERNLGEATVEATKLKFYFDKDTLVYNASAFITQDGFVLQNVLQKLPGVTMNEDGEILSNGRKVETLMLNGKDFFNDDRQTLLENLPAFMVKNIKVYEKEKDSLALFERERMMRGLVMDVRLKPEYHSTVIGNLDLGVGTDKHYYGRFLSMKIHDFHRWSLYVGANDVNKNEELTRNGQFYNMDNGTGEKDFYNAGFNYNVDQRDGKYALEGKARLQVSREWTDVRQVGQSFYSTGDIYSLNHSTNKAKNLSFQTYHTFTFLNDSPWALSIKPSLVYINSHNDAAQYYGAFDRNVVDSLGTFWCDSLKNHELGNVFRLYGINKMGFQSKMPTTLTQGKLEMEKSVDIPHTMDKLTFNGSAFYQYNSKELFVQREINYLRQQAIDWQNNYQDNWSETWNWNAGASYLYKINEAHTLTAGCKYEREHIFTSDMYYQLQNLSGWGIDNQHKLGQLPSETDMLQVIDPSNSKKIKETANTYKAEVNYHFEKNSYDLSVTFPLKVQKRSLSFFQNEMEKYASKTLVAPDLNLTFGTWMRGQTGYNYHISYTLEHKLPQMIYLIDQTNDANPLYVVKGNADLRSSVQHNLNGNIYWAPSMRHNHSLSLGYSHINGLTALSARFDRNSGVYTYTPQSVDGNQSFNVTLQDAVFLSPRYTHKLTNKLGAYLMKNVDFSGVSMEEYQKESTVRNYRLTEEITYNFSTNNTKIRGAFSPYIYYNRSVSNREHFQDINSFDFGAHFSMQFELPWSVRLNTDVRSVSRRGYNDDSMNDDEFIWNASLTKSFRNGISIGIESFDLLGQYKNVLRFVNAQGRTETIYNHLRRYAMLHMVWQFNKRK